MEKTNGGQLYGRQDGTSPFLEQGGMRRGCTMGVFLGLFTCLQQSELPGCYNKQASISRYVDSASIINFPAFLFEDLNFYIAFFKNTLPKL